VKEDETLTYAATYFAGAGGEAPSFAPRIAAAAVSAQDAGGLTFVPSLLSGTEILVKGAQYGLVTDGVGNRLGVPDATAGVALMEIPGAAFNQATDTASSFVTPPAATSACGPPPPTVSSSSWRATTPTMRSRPSRPRPASRSSRAPC
jgi:hypothetical protein